MTIIPPAAFAPDSADTDTAVSDNIKNVVPVPNGYGPMFDVEAYSEAALTGPALGAVAVRLTNGNTKNFVGTDTGLFEFASDRTFTDRTNSGGAYNLTDGEGWEFAQYGTTLIAVTGAEPPQKINIDSGTAFSDLGGSPSQWRYITVLGEILVGGSSNSTPNKVGWTDVGEPEDWSSGAAGEQEFPDGGWVRGVSGGKLAGYVFQETTIRRMVVSAGATYKIEFDRLGAANDIGVDAPYSRVSIHGEHYFLSGSGFHRMNPDESIDDIGARRVDEWFFDNVNNQQRRYTRGVIDPVRDRIFWFWWAGSNETAYADRYLCYDRREALARTGREWTYGDADISLAFSLFPLGIDLESLDAIYTDLDQIPVSLDSRIFQSGEPILGCFGSDDFLSTFSGSRLAAEIDTGMHRLIPGRRAKLLNIRPLVYGGTTAYTAAVRSRILPSDSIVVGSDVTRSSRTGNCPQLKSAYEHGARIKIPAGETWDKMIGIEAPQPGIDFVSDGV